jgi:hypothetical protein
MATVDHCGADRRPALRLGCPTRWTTLEAALLPYRGPFGLPCALDGLTQLNQKDQGKRVYGDDPGILSKASPNGDPVEPRAPRAQIQPRPYFTSRLISMQITSVWFAIAALSFFSFSTAYHQPLNVYAGLRTLERQAE